MQELHKERPSLKLLYVTPEQLVASTTLIEALQDLRRRGLLPRFVVDEVWLLPADSVLLSLPCCFRTCLRQLHVRQIGHVYV